VVAAIQRVRRTPGAGLLTLLVIMWIAAAIVVPRFAGGENLLNIVRQSSDLIVAAIGVMLVLLIGGIDLSIGSVYGLVSVVVVSAILTTGSPALAVGIALGAGAVVGIINGLVVHFARIPAFITTLGMFYIALAVAQLLSAGESLRVPSDSPFQGLTNARILGIPVMILVALFVAVGMWVLLNHTTFGREIVAVGFNRQAARLSGISVARVVIACFAIAGTLAALGAIMSTTRIQTGEPSLGGFNTTFEVITAAVVGGTSLFGGRGNVLGVVVGALIIRTIGNCITLLNITPLLYQAVMGSLILVALVVEVTRTRLSGGER
jgi:ribose transport system permease protein